MRNEKITPLYERLSRDDELQGESTPKSRTLSMRKSRNWKRPLLACTACSGLGYFPWSLSHADTPLPKPPHRAVPLRRLALVNWPCR